MKYGAQVVKGELKSALLDGDTQNYDLDHGFSRHPIEDDGRAGIQVKLGQAFIINHIRILLWDRDSRYTPPKHTHTIIHHKLLSITSGISVCKALVSKL